MKRLFLFIIVLLNYYSIIVVSQESFESIKLSFSKYSKDELRVTWYTKNSAMIAPTVLYSTEIFNPQEFNSNLIQTSIGEIITYDTPGFNSFTTTAIMINLIQSTIYYYCIGDKSTNEWSQIYNTTTRSDINSDSDDGDTIIPFTSTWFGDMGYIKGDDSLNSDVYTIDNLKMITNRLSFITHVGDIAYADSLPGSKYSGNESIWNEFLDSITPISSSIPYMTVPGNHDNFNDQLSVYAKTWQMPTDHHTDNWYSYNYNGVHFIGISSEDTFIPLSKQHTWIENDLIEYRKSNPNGWIVMFAHRPFYCSCKFNWCYDDSKEKTEKELYVFSLEGLLYQYNVDLFISGHMHAYEVSKPVYQSKVMGDFNDPKATVHIVVGTGGNKGGDLTEWMSPQDWNSDGLRTSLNGYGLLNIINSTTLNWQFIVNLNNTILDEFYLTKGNF